MNIEDLKIDIYADGSSLKEIEGYSSNNLIKGFTTNPSLMKMANVTDYASHSKEIIKTVSPKPISLEVFSDDLDEMYNQAKILSSWGSNEQVKIPITNTKNVSCCELIKVLIKEKIQVNVTAVFTLDQVEKALDSLNNSEFSILSIFSGRIADAGIDPEIICKKAVQNRNELSSNVRILWASSREIFNLIQANRVGCDIITLSYELLGKINNLGKDLNRYSLETVMMFYEDAKASGYKLN